MKVLFCFLGLIFILYISVFISNLDKLPSSLFTNINIAQIITPIIQILITLSIVYYVNIKLSKANKSKDVLIDLLSKYENHINQIYTLSAKYISDKTPETAKEIKWELKRASIKVDKLTNLYNMFEDYSFKYEITNIKKELLELKKAITDDPFMQENDYTSAERTRILMCFENIESNINLEKVNLFK